jgi:hypothetical protein
VREVLSWNHQDCQTFQFNSLLTKSNAKHYDTPADHVARQNFTHLVTLQKNVTGEFEDHIDEICKTSDNIYFQETEKRTEDGSQPAILLTVETSVLT